MASSNYIHWPKHRKKAAEQKRRHRRGVTLADLRKKGDETRRENRISKQELQ